MLSGLSMFGAILIKGPVALFPLAVPVLSLMHDAKKPLRVLTTFIVLLTTLIALLSLMLATNTAAVHFFKRYMSQQVLASVTGAREISTSRLHVFAVVGRESLVPLLVGGTLGALVYRQRQTAIASVHSRLFLYYLGIALAGSLPILVSAKQKRWYAFPSLPFYAMAIAVVFNDAALVLERWVDDKKKMGNSVSVFSAIILCIAVSLMFIEKNSPGRHRDFHADLSKQNVALEERKVVSVYPTQLATHWTLVANMQRTFRASLSEHFGQEYLLTTIEYMHSADISSHYTRIPPFETKKYVLFKLKD
jgi:4-amino-4-deoxy-L-arabinose transferase-like glycosyltransferase